MIIGFALGLIQDWRVFEGTVSPSGRCSVAWRTRVGSTSSADLEPNDVENCVLSMKDKTVLVKLTGHNDFVPRNHSETDVAYSSNEEFALVKQHGRWNTEQLTLVSVKLQRSWRLWHALSATIEKYSKQHPSPFKRSEISKVEFCAVGVDLEPNNFSIYCEGEIPKDERAQELKLKANYKIVRTSTGTDLQFLGIDRYSVEGVRGWQTHGGIWTQIAERSP